MPDLSPPPRGGKRSPLVYVAAGCGVLVILAVAAGGAGLYFLKRKSAEIREQTTNPELRTAKAAELLHADRLPDGYYAIMAVRVLAMDMVILGDQPPKPGGGASNPRYHGLIYTRMSREPANMKPLRAFVAGLTDDASALRSINTDLATKTILRCGSLSMGGGTVLYRAQRGVMTASSGGHQQGLQVVGLTDCPDQNFRLSIWFGPDPDPTKPPSELNIAGTVADENELRSFLSHFNVCGSAR